MHIRLFTLLLLGTQLTLGQAVTIQGKITNSRTEFVNKLGKRNTSEGVLPTGKIDIILPCTTLQIAHVAGSGGVAPVTKTITYELAYSTITGTKKCWLMQNLGSARPPLSATDNSEDASGWYWQFGSKTGYEYKTSRIPSTTTASWIGRTLTNVDWSANEDPCTLELGSGWRIPTYAEWQTIALNNVYAYGSEIAIHNAGRLQAANGVIQGRAITTYYWSQNSNTTTNAFGFVIPIQAGNSSTASENKNAGFSLRCIRD
jgi:hypothetical protein